MLWAHFFSTIQRRFGLRGAFLPSAIATVRATWTYLCLPLCPISLLYYNGGVDSQSHVNGFKLCNGDGPYILHCASTFILCGLVARTMFCCSNYVLYVMMINGKNMAVIEAKQSRNLSAIKSGMHRDAAIMLFGMPGAFLLLMHGIHRFTSTIMSQKSKQTSTYK